VQRSQGFTLIELMVVIAVLAIMIALATPSFADFFERYRLRGAADKVVTLLASARAESVMRNRDVSVDFKGSGGNWCVGANATPNPATAGDPVGVAASCDCSVANSCKLSDDRTLAVSASDLNGVTIGALPATMIFSSKSGGLLPLGTTESTTMVSPNSKYTLQLEISALGRAMLCVPAGKPAMAGFESC
jgi:type IV fimbrial biogenesis protein FimT